MQAFISPPNFWTNYRENNGCWEWLGGAFYPKRSKSGYGVIWYSPFQRQISVHRLAWILSHQQLIPKGMVIMHRCDNTICYNPDHLVIGTQKDNVYDMVDKHREGVRMRVSHCINGHEYTPENTFYRKMKNGSLKRFCRQCKNNYQKEYRKKHKHSV